jgi:inositol-phosphate transport system substrate-binding protein
MITSENASGGQDQDAACALLAKTTTPEINTLHAVDSTHLGILKSQASDSAYTQDRLLSDTLYMLDYNVYQPNHIMYGPWYDIVFDNMVKAENGEVTPEKAAEDAITLLQTELGDFLIVED